MVTNLSLKDIRVDRNLVIQKMNRFLGIDTSQLAINFATLKKIRIQITNSESVKPYASLEFRLYSPPTMALKEIVDFSYPVRMLTRDKQFYDSLSGKSLLFKLKLLGIYVY